MVLDLMFVIAWIKIRKGKGIEFKSLFFKSDWSKTLRFAPFGKKNATLQTKGLNLKKN